MRTELPHGVELRPLRTHVDVRGDFTEVFRAEWASSFEPVQWNVARSRRGALRGVHVHPFHDDYVVLLSGRATFGLHDARRGSPTEGLAATVELTGSELSVLSIPRGVAHGSLYAETSHLLVGVTGYHDPVRDELACHWSDPALGIAWPATPKRLSAKDAAAPPLASLLRDLEPAQPALRASFEPRGSALGRSAFAH